MMTSSEVFNYRLKICKDLGWADDARVLGTTQEALRMSVRRVLPDFEINKGDTRKYYAEDVANIFELKDIGLSNDVIAKSYNTTANGIKYVLSTARSKGFDVFPMRTHNR